MAQKITELKDSRKIRVDKSSSLFTNAELTAAWKRRSDDGSQYDVDLSVALTGDNGEVFNVQDFIYYDNYVHNSLAIRHQGDDREGSDDGVTPSEVIKLDLDKVPEKYTKLRIFVSIYRAAERKQDLHILERGQVALSGNSDGEKIVLDLTEFPEGIPAIQVGVLERSGDGWIFERDTLTYRSFAEMVESIGLEV